MPIYEYQCEDCEHKFEIMQKMSDDSLSDCPECNQSSLRKLVSATGFRLKGNGWYETDFKSGQKKNVTSSDNKAASKPKKEVSSQKSDTSSSKKSTK
ncbi:MAG: zinc ribbon domain-containing protein [Methylococcales bacterium]|jgi:putative FmdB family regulatory protein|nr:zinc ribbon domain-containing protein [Methylococcales bacterium]MBT7409255.1 zinc ribbon domain-containing protein [Methylococcales bacterium]